ncbi:metallophosphoesterase, partial [Candidatus Sumerlaeota bacterium]|nr:metallophosphoesterase [Candidatus Sumerlaeota bacterium]
MRRVRGFTLIELLIVVAIIAIVAATAVPNFLEAQARSQADAPWIFVSMPDFVNVDTEYPQKGWEDALGFILEAVRAEKPDFILVAGDLLMGHWGADPAKINQCADKYYAAWKKRLAAHGLTFYAALGDHEIADNPWRTPDRIRAVAVYKEAFRRWLGMPLNGPEHMKGTAYWFAHKNTLFVSVDVFEAGTSDQGGIAVGVTGPQLEWLERVLSQNRDVNHVIVMGHAPILGPLTMWSSSGLMVEGGRESPLWQA